MSAQVLELGDARRRRQAAGGVEPWMTKQQLAEHLQFSTRWIEQRVREGMPSEMWAGQRRFRATAAEDWLRRRACEEQR